MSSHDEKQTSNLTSLSCEAVKDKQSLDQLYVGDLFVLSCRSDDVIEWDSSVSLKPEAKEKSNPYSLVVQKVLATEPLRLDMLVTSYVPGRYQAPYVLTSGSQQFSTGKVNYTVRSILSEMRKKGEKVPTSPVGPLGPVKVDYPQWFWWALGFGILVFLAMLILLIKRRLKWQRWMAEVRQMGANLSPFNQFYKDLRKLRKITDCAQAVDELQIVYTQFLARTFQLPVHQLSGKEFIKHLGRRHYRIKVLYAKDILNVRSELKRAIDDKGGIDIHELEKLVEVVRKHVEKLNKEIEQ